MFVLLNKDNSKENISFFFFFLVIDLVSVGYLKI